MTKVSAILEKAGGGSAQTVVEALGVYAGEDFSGLTIEQAISKLPAGGGVAMVPMFLTFMSSETSALAVDNITWEYRDASGSTISGTAESEGEYTHDGNAGAAKKFTVPAGATCYANATTTWSANGNKAYRCKQCTEADGVITKYGESVEVPCYESGSEKCTRFIAPLAPNLLMHVRS